LIPIRKERTVFNRDGTTRGETATGFVVYLDPKKMWPLMVLRGTLAILFGIVALLWPGITLLVLALLFGAWALLDGISLLVSAFRQGRAHAHWHDWVPSLLAGLLGIAAAVVTVLMPAITVLVLTIVAAILLIGVGVAEIMIAVRLRRLIRGEVFLAVAGLFGIIAGIVILIWPLSGALALTFVLGVYALVSGVLLLAVALRLHHLARSSDVSAPARPGAGSAPWPRPGTP
jgi:uncharacterized membrane protein HdeD (DUF308 family)